MARHNAALKLLFLEFLKNYKLIEVMPPWYSPTQPKPFHENEQATVYRDVPVYADHTEVHANPIDARTVEKENQIVTLLEMSSPWVENREQKEKEKTLKYMNLFPTKKAIGAYYVLT